MTAGIRARAAASGRRLAAQVVVSVIATGAAALLVPQILTAIGDGRVATVGRAAMPAVQAPADFEAAFVWPVQTPPAAPPSVMAISAPMPAAMPVPLRAPHRTARVPGPRLAALAPRQAPARPPLQLVAMTSQAPAPLILATASPAPAEGRSLLGIPIPKLPYEDKIVAPLVRARDAVRSLF